MKMQRFEVPGLAHYSYLLGSNGRAAVIDPKRDCDTYLKYADANGFQITHVLETHIHADYESGALQLATMAGGELWLSAHDQGGDFEYRFDHHGFRDGEELEIGDLRIVALHTPGHTPEHLSFLLYEKSRCGQPMALFSGDFIFAGSLGRPDLLGETAKRGLAAALYESVHTKIAALPDGVEIHPAHGAGSLCGSGLAERAQSTLGYERHCNIFMTDRGKGDFIDSILKTVPEFPDYYRRMKAINCNGPRLLEEIPGDRPLTPAEFKQQLDKSNPVLIDLRRPEAYGGAHIPGSFNIGAGQNLSLWAGWIVPPDRPILLVADESVHLEEARRSLVRVGLDDIRGFLKGGMTAWIEAGFDQAHIPQVSVKELAVQLAAAEQVLVLDVRSAGEWTNGHIRGAVHIPGGDLPKRVAEVSTEAPVNVICGSGYRSSIATSVLKRAGHGNIVNVAGGMTAWNAQKLPTVR